MKPGFHPLLFGLALTLCLSPDRLWGFQEAALLFEGLERRADEVTFRFPWLIQTSSGLSVTASQIPREEFLQGLNAATDVVFDGTDALPARITLMGRYRNLALLLEAFCRDHLEVDCNVDIPSRSVRFGAGVDTGEGLSDVARIARYRRPLIDPALFRRNYGMHFSGALIIDGSLIPPPIEFQIEPTPAENRVVLKVNGLPVTEVAHHDVVAIDRNLYEASNLEQYKAALSAKLDHSWSMTSRFSVGSMRDTLNLFSRQAAFLHGVNRSEPTSGGLRLHLAAGSHLDWAIPDPNDMAAADSAEAYSLAQGIQNQAVGGLSLGGVVFLSNRFGVRVLPAAFEFNWRLNEIVAGDVDLQQKERRIRMEWRDEAEWILEYFYTSLVSIDRAAASAVLQPAPNPMTEFPTAEAPIPLDSPPPLDPRLEILLQDIDGIDSDPLPPELVPRALPPSGRGLIPSQDDSVFQSLPDEEVFDFEIDIEDGAAEEEAHGLDAQSEGRR